MSNRIYNYEEIAQDYKSGLLWNEIAKKHGCDIQIVARALRLLGIQKRGRKKGKEHPQWKPLKVNGGYLVTNLGNGKLRWEHRNKMEEMIGRTLQCWEVVHHVDGDKKNNEFSNLVIMPNREHCRFHTFLLHHGWEVDELSMRAVCRKDSPFVWRFSKKDYLLAMRDFPIEGRSSMSPTAKKCIKKCLVKGCIKNRYSHGYCNTHHQRRKAIEKGHWGYRNGKLIPCYLKTIK